MKVIRWKHDPLIYEAPYKYVSPQNTKKIDYWSLEHTRQEKGEPLSDQK